jgi:hypothetical protein
MVADIAFGWNLPGAVAGGLLEVEVFSMSVGLRALTLIAILAYLSAFLIRLRTATAQRSLSVSGVPEPRLVAQLS